MSLPGLFGEKFLPFVNIIHDAGSWNLAWILPCIIWTCIPKIISLAFFVWSEFIHFYVFLKILSVNYGRMKKARDTKFYMHIPRDLSYIFGKNYVPGNLHLAYFQILLKKAKMRFWSIITKWKGLWTCFYVGEVTRDMHIKFCAPGFLHSAVIDT